MSIINIIDKMKKTVTNIAGPSRGVKEQKIAKKSARRAPAASAKAAASRRVARSGR
mgnify:CR=1 FL=1|tara:strand:- start:706 stop:873 length:168 start_codon:yes stop_codon:yes gene_type:complete